LWCIGIAAHRKCGSMIVPRVRFHMTCRIPLPMPLFMGKLIPPPSPQDALAPRLAVFVYCFIAPEHSPRSVSLRSSNDRKPDASWWPRALDLLERSSNSNILSFKYLTWHPSLVPDYLMPEESGPHRRNLRELRPPFSLCILFPLLHSLTLCVVTHTLSSRFTQCTFLYPITVVIPLSVSPISTCPSFSRVPLTAGPLFL